MRSDAPPRSLPGRDPGSRGEAFEGGGAAAGDRLAPNRLFRLLRPEAFSPYRSLTVADSRAGEEPAVVIELQRFEGTGRHAGGGPPELDRELLHGVASHSHSIVAGG